MAASLSTDPAAGRPMDGTSLNVFRGSKAPPSEEHGFCFAVQGMRFRIPDTFTDSKVPRFEEHDFCFVVV